MATRGWTTETRALLNGSRHAHPLDPQGDLLEAAWADLGRWAEWLPAFEASPELRAGFEAAAAQLRQPTPPAALLDAQSEIFRFHLLTDAWAAARAAAQKPKGKATKSADKLRLGELALQRRSLATFWARTDAVSTLAIFETPQAFEGSVPVSGPTRYATRPAPRAPTVRTRLHVADDALWAGLRRALFSAPAEVFEAVSASMVARADAMADDPRVEQAAVWKLRVACAYALGRDPGHAHALAERFLRSPSLWRRHGPRFDCMLAGMVDAELARRFSDEFMAFDGPSPGVSVWLDAAEGLGAALAPTLEALIARGSDTWSKEQLWCLSVARGVLP